MTNIIVWDISTEINKDYTITQSRWARSTSVSVQPRGICTGEGWDCTIKQDDCHMYNKIF